MGRTFIEHPGGARVYKCSNCETPLTNRGELISTVSVLLPCVCACVFLGLVVKLLVEALPSVYALQCLTGTVSTRLTIMISAVKGD